jgi:hypothetical protein
MTLNFRSNSEVSGVHIIKLFSTDADYITLLRSDLIMHLAQEISIGSTLKVLRELQEVSRVFLFQRVNRKFYFRIKLSKIPTQNNIYID